MIDKTWSLDNQNLTAKFPLAIALVGLLLLLPGLGGGTRVLTYHEVCFAQPAREMIASGEFLVPTIAGVSFPDKPPLMHWLVALCIRMFGESESAVRLPSVLAGIAIALLVYDIGRRCYSPLIGLIAGLIQLTTVYTLMQARLAECDILLCLLTTAALRVFGLVELGFLERSRKSAALVHLFTGLAFLTKGPIGIVFIGGAMFMHLALTRRLAGLWFWFQPAAFAVSATCVFGWSYAAYLSHPDILDGWRYHNLERFSGAHGKKVTPFFYLGIIPCLLFPWSPFVAAAVIRKEPEEKRFGLLTLCWILPGFLFLSASSWKHKHYIIPLMPPLSIWGAHGLLMWAKSSWKPIPLKLLWGFFLIVAAVGLGILISKGESLAAMTIAIAMPLTCALTVSFQHWRRPTACVIAGIGGTMICGSIVLLGVLPKFDSYRMQSKFATRIAERMTADHPLYVPFIAAKQGVAFALPENQIVFYLPLNVEIIPGQKNSHTTALPSQPFLVLAPLHMEEDLETYGSLKIVDQCDAIRGSMVLEDKLTLFQVDPTQSQASRTKSDGKIK